MLHSTAINRLAPHFDLKELHKLDPVPSAGYVRLSGMFSGGEVSDVAFAPFVYGLGYGGGGWRHGQSGRVCRCKQRITYARGRWFEALAALRAAGRCRQIVSKADSSNKR